MLLKKVFRHSKGLFVLMVVFVAGQLFISYKHGMIVSPFYNYGMYSEAFKVNDSYQTYELIQNGQMLRGQDFSPQQWDKIFLPVQYYANINRNNDLYEQEVKRLMNKVGIVTSHREFIQQCNYAQFTSWYRSYLTDVTNHETVDLTINFRKYNFTSGRLVPTDSIIPLSSLCR